jgi:putative ABC transport system ATP-binding protein
MRPADSGVNNDGNKKIVLSAVNLCKSFKAGSVEQKILIDLDIEFYEGDFTIIMGSSGAGKSTLLYCVSGMDKPTGGQIFFGEKDISGLSNDGLAVFRRDNCGFVFQQVYLLDNMSIMDNILAAGFLASADRKKVVSRANELLDRVGLDETARNKFPSQVSGGQAARGGIVRGLINNPRILFADEPTGALNSKSGKDVLDVLNETNLNFGQSIIMVTHDLKSAARGDRIIYLKDGGVHGTMRLDKYDEADAERGDRVLEFLKNMGW